MEKADKNRNLRLPVNLFYQHEHQGMKKNEIIFRNEFGSIVANHVSAKLAYWDNNLVCRFANNAFKDWFEKRRGEVVGKITMKKLLGTEYENILPYIKDVFKGKKQVFKSKVTLASGEIKYSVVSFFPDILMSTTTGFFVHIEDITPIVQLEEQLRSLELSKRKELLHSVIETREEERKIIADVLRESISQTLAYCNVMLQGADKGAEKDELLSKISDAIQKAILELNVLSNQLSPFAISHFGLIPAIEDTRVNFESRYDHTVSIFCENNKIEEIFLNDKVSVFRIVQNYLQLISTNPTPCNISVSLDYKAPVFMIRLANDDLEFEFPYQAPAYNNINNWVECYSGTLLEKKEKDRQIIEIQLDLTKYGF